MRSGNMAARYETNSIQYTTYLTATLASGATTGSTIQVYDATIWPSSGTLYLVQAAATGAQIEYITYSAKSTSGGLGSHTLTINARAQTGGASTAQTFTYSTTAPIQVSLYSPQVASTINHWGSSVMMDGRYDDDKSLVFAVGMNTAFSNLAQNIRYAMISLRVSPSVDSNITGLLGQREIMNRMQLILRSMDAYATAVFRIDVVLNGAPASGTFAPVGGSSLSQYCVHAASTLIAGGESIFSFFTTTTGITQQDLSLVRDIGTSILGGGTSLTVPTYVTGSTNANGRYPDGPDIVTICCTAVSSATNSINSRVSWTEAQA
jgi:hypothetical protein